VYDPANSETGEQPVGTLTVVQRGTLEGVDFNDQGQLDTLFPDAVSARVTGRTWVPLVVACCSGGREAGMPRHALWMGPRLHKPLKSSLTGAAVGKIRMFCLTLLPPLSSGLSQKPQ